MRKLTQTEIDALLIRGCECGDWTQIDVADDFCASAVRNVVFSGSVTIGSLSKISNATIEDCSIGNGCTVRNIGVVLSGYDIADGVGIIDCGTIVSSAGATYGIGVAVDVVNEAGGREVPLSAHLSSNVAYLMTFHRYKPEVVEALKELVRQEIVDLRKRATIGRNTQIVGCTEITDVRFGEYCQVKGAQRLTNGTILSVDIQPTTVGNGVFADDFVFAEGAKIFDGAMVKRCFVGQCAQVGYGFFAENSLIFANSQLLNGEAVAAFAGAFTVSHHKTTLLIAAAYSFFNAGSATNKSNHHYKLGPSHQAVLERGVKTGSGSYILEPARIGAYSMVVGQHKGHPDTSAFPFSYLVERGGDSYLLVAQNLKTIGLFRDEEKWRSRDARHLSMRRDRLTVEVFNPLTVAAMLSAAAKMDAMVETSKADTITCDGVRIQKAFLPRAAKAYRQVAKVYVVGSLFEQMSRGSVVSAAVSPDERWVDMGGLVALKSRVDALEQSIANGEYGSLADVEVAISAIAGNYKSDAEQWCLAVAEAQFGLTPNSDKATLCAAAQEVVDVYADLMKSTIADAQKEFGGRLAVGYGIDGDAETAKTEYQIIKGTPETNAVIAKCEAFYNEKMSIAKEFISNFAGLR